MPLPSPSPSAVDVFGWLAALWTKERPTGTPPVFMMHRFLASDRLLANAARATQLLRDPDLIFGTWQALLPRDRRGAPRLAYIAPKKSPAAEELVTRMQRTLAQSRRDVEDILEIVTLLGQDAELYCEYGIERL
jgi:hypothetical protein